MQRSQPILEEDVRTGRNRRLYLARFKAHLDKLVSSAWRTIESVARNGWLEDVKDGAEIRTFGSWASSSTCSSFARACHI